MNEELDIAGYKRQLSAFLDGKGLHEDARRCDAVAGIVAAEHGFIYKKEEEEL